MSLCLYGENTQLMMKFVTIYTVQKLANTHLLMMTFVFMVNKHNLYCSKAGKHSFTYDDICLYGE